MGNPTVPAICSNDKTIEVGGEFSRDSVRTYPFLRRSYYEEPDRRSLELIHLIVHAIIRTIKGTARTLGHRLGHTQFAQVVSTVRSNRVSQLLFLALKESTPSKTRCCDFRLGSIVAEMSTSSFPGQLPRTPCVIQLSKEFKSTLYPTTRHSKTTRGHK